MSYISFVLYALAIFLLGIIHVVYSAWTDALRDIPGPAWARYTRLWYLWNVCRGRFHERMLDLHREYAKPGEHHARIIRLAPNYYSIASPEKVVYGIASKFPKGSWYKGWVIPNTVVGLFQQRDMAAHAEERRKVSSLYSLSSLIAYEPHVEGCLDLFYARLEKFADEGRTVDMAQWLQYWAFDTIGQLTFSKPFGFLDQGIDVKGICAAVDQSTVYSTLVGIYPWIHPILFRVLKSLPGGGASGTSYVINMAAKIVRERAAQFQSDPKSISDAKATRLDNGPRDFLDRTMDSGANSIQGSVDFDEGAVMTMCLQNMFAGSDTTAVSSASILYHLVKNPESLQKLRDELAVYNQNGHVKFRETQHLTYLQACIKEGLRLHPATGLPLWKTVPTGGAEIYGRFFPPGVEVGINVWVPHYDCDIWGSDAHKFRPERWIEAIGSPRLEFMDNYYMPFGLGSRTCVGKNISLLEISKLIPHLVMRFDFELEQQHKLWITRNVWFVKPLSFNVKVKHRKVKI